MNFCLVTSVCKIQHLHIDPDFRWLWLALPSAFSTHSVHVCIHRYTQDPHEDPCMHTLTHTYLISLLCILHIRKGPVKHGARACVIVIRFFEERCRLGKRGCVPSSLFKRAPEFERESKCLRYMHVCTYACSTALMHAVQHNVRLFVVHDDMERPRRNIHGIYPACLYHKRTLSNMHTYYTDHVHVHDTSRACS